MNHALVRRVTTEVREWAELAARKRGFAEDLECFCAIGAAKLFIELHAAGVQAYIVCNEYHAFVEVENFIVDITATQFGKAPVFIQNRNDFEDHQCFFWSHKDSTRFKDVHSFREYQCHGGWPADQIVFKNLLP